MKYKILSGKLTIIEDGKSVRHFPGEIVELSEAQAGPIMDVLEAVKPGKQDEPPADPAEGGVVVNFVPPGFKGEEFPVKGKAQPRASGDKKTKAESKGSAKKAEAPAPETEETPAEPPAEPPAEGE